MPFRLLPPGQCPLCLQWCRGRLCADCAQLLEASSGPRCGRCALRLPPGRADGEACGACLKSPPPWTRAVAALDYRFPWDRLVQDFKFQERLELAALLSEQLDHALSRHGPDAAPDLLLPVPLAPARLRQRGYNQSLELARQLARRRQWRLSHRTLLRLRHDSPQAGLPLAQRQHHLRGAFAVLDPDQQLRGRRVALLDDVMTSGATLREATGTLLRAGAAEVQVLVVARTP